MNVYNLYLEEFFFKALNKIIKCFPLTVYFYKENIFVEFTLIG